MNKTVENTYIYCDLEDFKLFYRSLHWYLSTLVCTFGSITNILNIVVLSTKHMRCPTNYILTALAASDLLVMLEYVPFVYYSTNHRRNVSYFTYSMAVFIYLHAIFTQAFHFTSCCLTVLLAVWRYVAIKFPQHNNKWCGENRTKCTIFGLFVLCPFICTPLYFSLRIIDIHVNSDASGKIYSGKTPQNVTLQNVTIYTTTYSDNIDLKKLSFYIYGVVIKLIPCILLTVLSFLLILGLIQAKKRRRNLMNPTGASKKDGAPAKKKVSKRFIEKEKQADRTTRMLLVVLLLFLMVELPQSIFGLLNHIIGAKFDSECYQPLGEFIDVVALTNSSINFVLYCIMSTKFRSVFKEIFLKRLPCFKGKKQEWTSLQTLKTYV